MGVDNRLRARVPDSHLQHISTLAQEQYDGKETEAERKVVEAGLESLGYVDRPADAIELFLWYVRRIGLVLGFVGLICMGYGVFGARLFSVIGFSLLLGGFLFVALEEGIRQYEGRHIDQPVIEGARANE